MGDLLDLAGGVVEVLHLVNEGVLGLDDGSGEVEGALNAS
jgi:hypothetical protein